MADHRIAGGERVPLGELVEEVQGVLVGGDLQRAVDVDPETSAQDPEHLLEVDLARPLGRLGAAEQADYDPGRDPEDRTRRDLAQVEVSGVRALRGRDHQDGDVVLDRRLARHGQPGKAVDHLSAYLDAQPEAEDAAPVAAILKASRQRLAQWN